MIGSDQPRRRGSPLTMLALLVVIWIGGRAATWENPLTMLPAALPGVEVLIADQGSPEDRPTDNGPTEANPPMVVEWRSEPVFGQILASALSRPVRQDVLAIPTGGGFAGSATGLFGDGPSINAGHQMLLAAAFSHSTAAQSPFALSDRRAPKAQTPGQRPFASTPFAPNGSGLLQDRWTLDAWAFGRQGSNSAAIAQGRTPIYGASQVGAILRYRLAPSSRRAPEAYARVYRALVSQGESEVALGVSARPLGRIPLRAQAELRVTDNQFGTNVRPAAFVVTEVPPQELPAGLTAEVYGQAGYVGGTFDTAFAEAQAILTREVAQFDLADNKSARFSVGAGAWGGAQKDATRVDLGPTMRVDLTIGKVPARLSVDWREQVAGDASPGSGVAATLSTRF